MLIKLNSFKPHINIGLKLNYQVTKYCASENADYTKRDGDECRADASRMPVFNAQAGDSPPHHALFGR